MDNKKEGIICFMNQEMERRYYQEIDKNKRKVLLEQAIKEDHLNREDALRQEIWNRRYKRREREPEGVDYYIRGWMSVVYLKRQGSSVFGRRREQKEIQKIKEDWNLDFLQGMGDSGEKILYQELYNMVKCYINLCMNDRNYCSYFMGMMQMNQKKLTGKIAEEVSEVSVHAPRILQMEDGFRILQDAASDAFTDMFPEGSHLIKKIEHDSQ